MASSSDRKYKLVKSLKGYYTSIDAKNRKNPKMTMKAGTYYLLNIYNGMYNIGSSKKSKGIWINPNDNKKATTKTSGGKSPSKTKKQTKSTPATTKKKTVSIPMSKIYRVNAFGQKVLRGYIVREDNGSVIPFQFNPDSWQRSHKAIFTTIDAPGSPYPEVNYIRQDKRVVTIKISYDKRVDSQNCSNVDTIIKNYENLIKPSSSYTILQRGSKKFVAPPTCRFVFGSDVIKCKVVEVKVNHTAFDKNLKTTACMVEMEILEVP